MFATDGSRAAALAFVVLINKCVIYYPWCHLLFVVSLMLGAIVFGPLFQYLYELYMSSMVAALPHACHRPSAYLPFPCFLPSISLLPVPLSLPLSLNGLSIP